MNWKIALNDFKKNKLVNLATALFILLGASLLSLVLILIINLTGSIDNLIEKAKSPDYLQMHQGEIDLERLSSFADESPFVKEYQTLEFLNIDRDKIEINGHSLKNTVEDNGFSVQSEKFDFLLDLNNEIITVNKGEIYLPLMYMKNKTAKPGDMAKIAGKDLVIKGFLRDSQMNSNMAGSKRFLVNQADFDDLKAEGKNEYLIEFILNDRSQTTDFEKEYQDKIPEKNGPSVTYAMFKMINALSDGIFIAVLILASLLILAISLLCIKFSLNAKIEDEYREIGVMKAIGIRNGDIKKIYLGQYVIVSLIALILAYLISLAGQNLFLENIFLYMGKSSLSYLSQAIPILGLIILFLIIVFYVNLFLNSINKVSTIQAISSGALDDKSLSKKLKMEKNLAFGSNFFLGLADVNAKKKNYLSVFWVILLASFLLIIPQNLYNTLNDEDFMTNLGMGKIHASIDVAQVDKPDILVPKIIEKLSADKRVKDFQAFETRNIPIVLADGKEAFIKASLGNHDNFKISYSKGRVPLAENEIALTSLYLEDLGLKVGDTIKLKDRDLELQIVGEYSDVSNGGKTAKAVFKDDSKELLKTTVALVLNDKSQIDEFMDDYSKEFDQAKVSSIQEYLDQSFGPMIKQIGNARTVAFAAVIVVLSTIIILFTRLLIAKDKRQISILKTIGFRDNDLIWQYLSRFIIVMAFALILATILANTLGLELTKMFLGGAGLGNIRFVINPWISYLLIPVFIAGLVLLASRYASSQIKNIKISDYIKE